MMSADSFAHSDSRAQTRKFLARHINGFNSPSINEVRKQKEEGRRMERAVRAT
jgi:hypothetical protein